MSAITSEGGGEGADLGVNIGERGVKGAERVSELGCRGRDRREVVGGGDKRLVGARGELL